MQKQNYRPPPCSGRRFYSLFYRYFSTGQTSADSAQHSLKLQYPQLKKMNNNSQTHFYIFKLTKGSAYIPEQTFKSKNAYSGSTVYSRYIIAGFSFTNF